MIADGDVDLVIGTHALIQEGVHFHRLGVAVVDEQHRFGVHQRVDLKEKAGDVDPDLLIMTATPIPRTLAMTLYGDLDVTLARCHAPGPQSGGDDGSSARAREIGEVYQLIREQVAEGRQAFVVCPLVEESPKVEAASATTELQRLQGVLTGLRVGLIHGQLPSVEKESVMRAMKDRRDRRARGHHRYRGRDRHPQRHGDGDRGCRPLRFEPAPPAPGQGRPSRVPQSTCVLMSEPTTEEGEQRVAAMVGPAPTGSCSPRRTCRIRGQGTVFGARQSGLPDLRLADILRDADLLVTARREAFRLVGADPHLERHPELAEE